MIGERGLVAVSSPSILPDVSGYHTEGVTGKKHISLPFSTLIWRSRVQTLWPTKTFLGQNSIARMKGGYPCSWGMSTNGHIIDWSIELHQIFIRAAGLRKTIHSSQIVSLLNGQFLVILVVEPDWACAKLAGFWQILARIVLGSAFMYSKLNFETRA